MLRSIRTEPVHRVGRSHCRAVKKRIWEPASHDPAPKLRTRPSFGTAYQSGPPNRFDLRQSAARPFLAPPKRQASALIVLVAPVK
jgi:hypothetical protein